MSGEGAMSLEEIERFERSAEIDEPHSKPNGDGRKRKHLLQSSADFVAGYVAPDYLVDRIIQRRYLYSLTAPTGSGKTAIALTLAAHVATGRRLGEHHVDQGRVLIFAGENPDDIGARWMAMAEQMAFDVNHIDVHFIPGKFSIPDMASRIEDEIKLLGGIALTNVDTSAVYFDGDDENSNVQLGNHARMLRNLTKLPGGPCVIVNCHPVKNASADNLIPRGGGAFLNEVDGNLVCIGSFPLIDLSWHGKLRGPGFEPVSFELVTVQCDGVRDSKGRHIPTVIARHLSEREKAAISNSARDDQDTLLITMLENDGASIAALAEKAGWFTGPDKDKPHKSKVARELKDLERDRLAKKIRNTWNLTDAGKKEAEKIKVNHDLAGARYS